MRASQNDIVRSGPSHDLEKVSVLVARPRRPPRAATPGIKTEDRPLNLASAVRGRRWGHARLGAAPLAAVTVVSATIVSACAEPEPEWRPATTEREFHAWETETLWTRGGIDEDTVLYGPWAVRGSGDQAIVLDRGGYRIRAFDLGTGDVRWSFGSGGDGPGEFRDPVDALPLADGSIVVWDLAVGRLTWVSADGRLERMVQPDARSTPMRFCELSGGTLVALHGSADNTVSALSPGGELLPRASLPWRSYRRLDPLQRQAEFAAGPGGECVYYLTQSTGFARFTAEGFGPPHDYVEPMAPPGADVQMSRTERRVRLDGYRLAVHAGFVREGELWLAFRGETSLASRLIDVFDVDTGAYLRSYRLPWTVSGVAAGGDVVLLLSTRDAFPVLVATRAPWAQSEPS